MFGLGAQELVVILVIVLVLFGGSKLPDLAKSLGVDEGIQEGDRSGDRGGAGSTAETRGGAASMRALQEPARDRLEPLPPLWDARGPGPGTPSPEVSHRTAGLRRR